MTRLSIRNIGHLFVEAYRGLIANDPLRLAGATAFFTLFALPPILIILIQVLGLLFDPEIIRVQLFHTLSAILATETVENIISILKSMRNLTKNWMLTGVGFIFLLFVATTLFKVIRTSVNELWRVRIAVKRNMMGGIQNRFRAIVIILLAGLLFIGALLAEAIQALLGKYIRVISPDLAFYFNGLFTYLLSIFIVTVWFAVLFHHLPDGRPTWRIALAGGLVTSILFNLGKLALRWLLTFGNIQTIYGASGSIVLLLLFVFYSSLIFYYGAAFTKCLAIARGKPILPHSYAVSYEISTPDAKINH
ncbi:MAG TPA: YihY/virulence factor BrkB family protein [Flavitalea sp.]|nr:YihY/virulence factor BrkB family protein [Flavitalea sp.]